LETQAVEIEIKFHLPNPETTRADILSLGATSMGRLFERNVCFENTEKTFKVRDILLRLRQDDKSRLTFKSPPDNRDDQFKVYNELEVEVSDFDTCFAILKRLGFLPEKTYEKWRETFVLDQTKLLIDTTPLGTFLEIEGDKSKILTLARRLGFDWRHRILLNYLEIFDIINKQEDLGLSDMTFDSFRSVGVDLSNHLPDLFVS
jgi:adenylate cyclase class 2